MTGRILPTYRFDFDKLLLHNASMGIGIVVFVIALYLLGLCYTAVELEDN